MAVNTVRVSRVQKPGSVRPMYRLSGRAATLQQAGKHMMQSKTTALHALDVCQQPLSCSSPALCHQRHTHIEGSSNGAAALFGVVLICRDASSTWERSQWCAPRS